MVIQNGGGFYGWSLVGKRVAFTRMFQPGGKFTIGGTWAQYVITSAFQCVVLDNDMSFEQGCTAIVNPLSCVGLRDTALALKTKGAIVTAAYSQLGRMLIQALHEKGVNVIAVVRKQA